MRMNERRQTETERKGVYLFVHVCGCMCAHLCVCACVCTHMCTYMCVRACCMCASLRICVRTCAYTHVCVSLCKFVSAGSCMRGLIWMNWEWVGVCGEK